MNTLNNEKILTNDTDNSGKTNKDLYWLYLPNVSDLTERLNKAAQLSRRTITPKS